MFSIMKLLSYMLCIIAFTGQTSVLTLTTEDGFDLKAEYFQPQEGVKRAVLLLHQCNLNRTMYNELGHELSLRGIHALSLDFRWFGESIDGKTDIRELAKLPEEERKNPWETVMEFWQKDVQLAYNYLREKIGKSGTIGVIGASCGGGQILILAEKNPIKAISFFSSAFIYEDDAEEVANYKAKLADKPTLFISADKDGTFVSTQFGFSINENLNSKFISYKGKNHGYPLLEQDKDLTRIIADWFDRNI